MRKVTTMIDWTDVFLRGIAGIGVVFGVISFEYIGIYLSTFHFADFPYLLLGVCICLSYLLLQLFTRMPLGNESLSE